MEGIIYSWIMDHKVFLITNGQSKSESSDSQEINDISIYYADFNDGIPIRLDNAGNSETMEFSIHLEGNGFFVGLFNGERHIINKADFYAEQYDKSKIF